MHDATFKDAIFVAVVLLSPECHRLIKPWFHLRTNAIHHSQLNSLSLDFGHYLIVYQSINHQAPEEDEPRLTR